MEIQIPDYEQKKLDRRRVSLTVRLSQVQASALRQVFWKGQEQGSSLSSILRIALSEHLKNKYGVNIEADLKFVDE